MSAQDLASITARYAGHPFVDYFDCLDASLAAAKLRSKLAVRARLAGEVEQESYHLGWKRYHWARVRHFHKMIDWSEE